MIKYLGGNKFCKTCNEYKAKEEYNKKSCASDGLKTQCRDCQKNYSKAYQQRPEVKENTKRWVNENIEKVRLSYRKYSKKRDKEKLKIYHREWARKRRKEDVLYLLKDRCQARIKDALTQKGYKKKNKTTNMLGCDIKFFRSYIESKFSKGMNWENRSTWHLDHIIPCSSAKTEKELINLFHYTNIQPLWAFENLSKAAEIPNGHQVSLRI
jgi:hypothetical protein